jgi:hypothetical protein
VGPGFRMLILGSSLSFRRLFIGLGFRRLSFRRLAFRAWVQEAWI